jgi:hypothetical protein
MPSLNDLKTSVAILLHPQYQICCTNLVVSKRRSMLLPNRSACYAQETRYFGGECYYKSVCIW